MARHWIKSKNPSHPVSNVASYSNASKSANALPSDPGVHVAEEAVMRAIPLVLITFVVLSLSTSAVRAGANGSWCAKRIIDKGLGCFRRWKLQK